MVYLRKPAYFFLCFTLTDCSSHCISLILGHCTVRKKCWMICIPLSAVTLVTFKHVTYLHISTCSALSDYSLCLSFSHSACTSNTWMWNHEPSLTMLLRLMWTSSSRMSEVFTPTSNYICLLTLSSFRAISAFTLIFLNVHNYI